MIQMQQIAGVRPLIALDHGRRFEQSDAIQADALQHPRHRRPRHSERRAHLPGRRPRLAQRHDRGSSRRPRRGAVADAGATSDRRVPSRRGPATSPPSAHSRRPPRPPAAASSPDAALGRSAIAADTRWSSRYDETLIRGTLQKRWVGVVTPIVSRDSRMNNVFSPPTKPRQTNAKCGHVASQSKQIDRWMSTCTYRRVGSTTYLLASSVSRTPFRIEQGDRRDQSSSCRFQEF